MATAVLLPEGRKLDLPGRGTTWVRELPGPTPTAPTVLLLHGLGATGLLNWFPAFKPLSRDYRVVAVDHRGHGRGIRSRRAFRLEDCADDVAAIIDELDIGRAILVGYSMGGPIAQLTWHRSPEVVRGMVLCATSYRFGPADRRMMIPMADALGFSLRFTPRLVRQQMMRGAIGINPRVRGRASWALDELNSHDPAALVEAAVAIRRFDSTPWIGDLDVPASSVVTAYDRLVPPRRQEKLAALTHGKVFRVDGGHDVCVTNPQRFVPALLNAVRSVATR
jgi:pimeloyl-ACP methyl ester carboxylesterase